MIERHKERRESEEKGKGKVDREGRAGMGQGSREWAKVWSGPFQLPGTAFSKAPLTSTCSELSATEYSLEPGLKSAPSVIVKIAIVSVNLPAQYQGGPQALSLLEMVASQLGKETLEKNFQASP